MNSDNVFLTDEIKCYVFYIKSKSVSYKNAISFKGTALENELGV